jgi:hypothetical protein
MVVRAYFGTIGDCTQIQPDIPTALNVYFTSRVRVTIQLNQAEPVKVTMLTYNVNQVLNIMQLNNY